MQSHLLNVIKASTPQGGKIAKWKILYILTRPRACVSKKRVTFAKIFAQAMAKTATQSPPDPRHRDGRGSVANNQNYIKR